MKYKSLSKQRFMNWLEESIRCFYEVHKVTRSESVVIYIEQIKPHILSSHFLTEHLILKSRSPRVHQVRVVCLDLEQLINFAFIKVAVTNSLFCCWTND